MGAGTTGGSVQDFSTMPFGWGHVDKVTNWFSNADNSNLAEWWGNLSDDERAWVTRYTGSGYGTINLSQYTEAWEDMSDEMKMRISNLHNALKTFELNKTIQVNREADFQIFGSDGMMTVAQVKDFLNQTDGYVQNDGFMSFSTKPNGVHVDGSGLILHVKFPPSTGAGAYVAPYSQHTNESEWLSNSNSVFHFDQKKVYEDYEGIHVYGEWVGQNRAQTISPTYDKKALTNKRNKGRKK